MVLHDYRCASCGKVFEKMVSWDADETRCKCGSTALRVFIGHREYRAQSFDPVLVFRDKSGHYRFPGRNNAPAPKGYEPVYLRTRSEVDRFTKVINAKERQRYFQHKERNEARFSQWTANARSELRQKMQHMSPLGRAFAEASMRQNDSESSVNYNFDPGFHLEAFEYDAGSREGQRDTDIPRRK